MPGVGDERDPGHARRACSVSPATRNGRSPKRSTSAPATGATKNSVAVHGSSRRPAPSGSLPSPVCRNWARKKTALNSAANIRKLAALPAENARERNRPQRQHRRRARGAPRRRTRPAARAPAASEARTSALPQPAPLPRTRPHTIPNAASRDQRQPGQVERACRGPRLSGSGPARAAPRPAPIGTLIQKIHCQASPSATAPPITGPLATARPVSACSDPDRRAAPLGREGGADERERERHHEAPRRRPARRARRSASRRWGRARRRPRRARRARGRRRTACAGRSGRRAPTPVISSTAKLRL